MREESTNSYLPERCVVGCCRAGGDHVADNLDKSAKQSNQPGAAYRVNEIVAGISGTSDHKEIMLQNVFSQMEWSIKKTYAVQVDRMLGSALQGLVQYLEEGVGAHGSTGGTTLGYNINIVHHQFRHITHRNRDFYDFVWREGVDASSGEKILRRLCSAEDLQKHGGGGRNKGLKGGSVAFLWIIESSAVQHHQM